VKSPQRGEVWLVDLGMAAKVRPAVVISVPVDDADRALVTLVPHTTSARNSRFEIEVNLTKPFHLGDFAKQVTRSESEGNFDAGASQVRR